MENNTHLEKLGNNKVSFDEHGKLTDPITGMVHYKHNDNIMGLGSLGGVYKLPGRKFRWLAEMTKDDDQSVVLPPTFVKVSSRPQLHVEGLEEIDYLGATSLVATSWIPGKHNWEQISFTIFDAKQENHQQLFSYLTEAYNYSEPQSLPNYDCPKLTCNLTLLDGMGNPLEKWTILNGFITSIKFGELDYSSSSETDLTLTLRYESVTYNSYNSFGEPCVWNTWKS